MTGRTYEQTVGTGTGGTGDAGEAVAEFLTAGCVLLLLYGVWPFAVEAAKALTTVWGHSLYAVIHPFGAGHALLIACFALSWLSSMDGLEAHGALQRVAPMGTRSSFFGCRRHPAKSCCG